MLNLKQTIFGKFILQTFTFFDGGFWRQMFQLGTGEPSGFVWTLATLIHPLIDHQFPGISV